MSGTLTNWFPRFRRKRPAVVLKGQRQYPLGLDPREVEGLRTLLAGPGWACWLTVLERQFEIDVDRLLKAGMDYDQYLFQSGVVRALRHMADLPQAILDACPPPNEDESSGYSAGHRIFVNTPHWERFTSLPTTVSGT